MRRSSYGFPSSPMAITMLSLPMSAWLHAARVYARPQFFHKCACADSIHKNESKKNTLLSYIVYKRCAKFQVKILIRSQVIIFLVKTRYLGSYWSDVKRKTNENSSFLRTLRCSYFQYYNFLNEGDTTFADGMISVFD